MRNNKLKFILCLGIVTVFTQISLNCVFATSKVEMILNYDGAKHKYSENEINISIDGVTLKDFAVPPLSINGRTLLPARLLCEKLGANVNWNEETNEIYITKLNDIIVIQIGNPIGNKNGNPFTMETPPKIINGSTMIPTRSVAESLGCTVGWDNNTRTVTVVNGSNQDVKIPQDIIKKEEPDNLNTVGDEISVLSVSVPNDIISAESFSINLSGEVEKYEQLLVSENRLVIDIYNSNMQITNSDVALNGNKYVSAIRSAQNQIEPNKIARVVFDLKSNDVYNVILSNDKKNIIISFGSASDNSGIAGTGITGTDPTVTPPTTTVPSIPPVTIPSTPQPVLDTMKNMSYDYSLKTLVLNKVLDIGAVNIIHNDDYTNKKYSFILSGDYSEVYGSGTYNVNDTNISSISVVTTNGQTVITMNENKILGYIITEDTSNIYIKAVNPKELYSKIVVLDPGHGGSAPGNVGIDSTLIEKDLNLDIALRLYSLLEADPNIKVYSTRLTDVYPENPSRAVMANEIGDLFVSIHQNAFTTSIPNGTETLYFEHSNEVEGRLTSKLAAQFMQEYLVKAMGTTDRGVKRDPEIIVLNRTQIPAILFEAAFLTNPSDAELMRSDDFRDTIAMAMYSAISDMLKQYPVR